MRLKLKEDPKEWRKAALLGTAGLAVLSTILRWRGMFSTTCWLLVFAALALAAVCAWLRPRSFRGYYRFGNRLTFAFVQTLGFAVLAAVFVLVLTPLGFITRLIGKDPLQLHPQRDAQTFWQSAKKNAPLDRLF